MQTRRGQHKQTQGSAQVYAGQTVGQSTKHEYILVCPTKHMGSSYTNTACTTISQAES
jgi:hypothetical protein